MEYDEELTPENASTDAAIEDDVLDPSADGAVVLPPAPSLFAKNAAAATASATARHGSSGSGSVISSKGRGVCRVEVTRVEWNPLLPWQRTSQSKSSGTAFCIEGERLLTNAHVVKSAIDIRVRLFGSSRRYSAQVLVYAPEVDLAILQVDDDAASFFAVKQETNINNNNISSPTTTTTTTTATTTTGDQIPQPQQKRAKQTLALQFTTELPALQETIQVVGYPTGGKTICVTEGVVSRIDMLNHAGMFAIQVDSAINPGNSGGPALNHQGQVIGVAFRKRNNSSKKKSVDNIGYLIPSVVVQAFLGRIQPPQQETANTTERPTYTLDGSIPFRWHSLENKSLRLAHQVPDHVSGILITSVCETIVGTSNDCLGKGDVLTSIDNVSVADDGQVVLRGDELIQNAYLLKIKSLNEPVQMHVWRKGQGIGPCQPFVLRDIPTILPRWDDVDCQPNYLILGACVLLPFSFKLRQSTRCGTRLKADGIQWVDAWPNEWQGMDELVILTDILAHELTFSYQRAWRRVTQYNGIAINSLDHLRKLWEQSCQEVSSGHQNSDGIPTFARLALENDDDLVFEVAVAMEAQSQVLKTYEIPKPYQILPPNPNYQ